MKNSNCYSFLVSLLLIITIMGIVQPSKIYSQFISNGSFEIHSDAIYPRGLTGVSPTFSGYFDNELMRCIGFCSNHPFPWNPIDNAVCFGNQMYGNGWYWATYAASPDYFHKGGLFAAQVPYVGVFFDQTEREYRYPYGYPSVNHDDSAFVGLRIRAYKSLHPQFFNSYKEYIQSRLNTTITGPKIYEVKFYVSKSRHIYSSIKNIGVYFTEEFVVNPKTSYISDMWNRNLTDDAQPPNYLTSPQISSDFLLDQTADEFGHGGWQEIKGYFLVDEHEVYNYITIGNFQNDSALWADITPPFLSDDINEYVLYYFIDNLSVTAIDENYTGTCICQKNINKVEITLDSTNQDSLLCCYNYDIYIPASSYGLCGISKIIIRDSETILDEIIADELPPENPTFNGRDPITGTVCLDKFTQQHDITIQFFSRESEESYVLLAHCTQNIPIKCRCDCDDLAPYPYAGNSPKFKLQKVDDSENGNCCWDMVLTNPSTNDENSCELDLSDIYLHIGSSPNLAYYNFTPNLFSLIDSDSYRKKFKAPSDLIIKPGQSINIGRICSNGSPTNETELSFAFSLYEIPGLNVCDTVLKQKISCSDSIGCCNSFVLYADSIRHHIIDTISFCTTTLMLNYINTIEYCDYDDDISVSIYNNTDQVGYISHNFKLSEIYKFPIVISPLIPFTGWKEFCIHITNQRTQEECTKCIWVQCDEINPGEPMNKGSLEKSEKNDVIKIVPNPSDNWVDIYFHSEKEATGIIKLYTIDGDEILNKTTKVHQGKNSARISTGDFPVGMYLLVVNIDGRILSGTISVAR
ncbi:MAG: T9SS type A sorting domain-containing protein [Candidatus Kapabacteria bacterium]|nr:T9SS type A sorting domain-containing protein [Candidatus Kapabacteria bacterium]